MNIAGTSQTLICDESLMLRDLGVLSAERAYPNDPSRGFTRALAWRERNDDRSHTLAVVAIVRRIGLQLRCWMAGRKDLVRSAGISLSESQCPSVQVHFGTMERQATPVSVCRLHRQQRSRALSHVFVGNRLAQQGRGLALRVLNAAQNIRVGIPS
jgi:hypothetical protein